MPHDDSFDLQRFVDAQAPLYSTVLGELAAGDKRGHWMWFIFPQIQGLGNSSTAQQFALQSLEEARAYWAHPVLGIRLKECTSLLLGLEGRTAGEIFGFPDELKFRSSMTLFEAAIQGESLFPQALEQYYAGQRDALTLQLLAQEEAP